MSTGADYSLHLKSLGLDPQTMRLDTGGGLERPLASFTSDALPRVTVSAAQDEGAELTVVRTLGTGGMGEVMLAVQRALGREVALKRVQPHVKGTAASAELLREALVTGRLEHPNIVPVHMLAVAPDGTPFFVMKRIEGTPWRKLLKDPASLQRLKREASEPLVQHLDVFLAVCDAVSFAHSRGVLHRDLKPDNVMVGAFGEVYVLDWGIAVGLDAESGLPRADAVNIVTGTPAYMAPEMAAADGKAFGPGTDVFLLGAMLFELLAGRPPHAGKDPLDTLDQAWKWRGLPDDFAAPEVLREVVRRAMARKVEDRFESVDALRAAVVEFLRHRDAVALADEAKARAGALRALLAGAGPVDEAEVQRLFSEASFGFAQAVRSWPQLDSARRAHDALVADVVRRELSANRPATARGLLARLFVKDEVLDAAVAEAEARQSAREHRLDALERDLDLDRAVATRGLMSIAQGIVCGVFILVMGELGRRGLFTFAHREAFIGLCVFAFVHLVFVDRFLRARLNQVGLRALNANAVALLGLVGFWGATWALQVPLHAAVVLFMLFIALGWGLVAAMFDTRTSVVALTYLVGSAATWAWPAAMYELFGGATVVAFVLLGFAWRKLRARTT